MPFPAEPVVFIKPRISLAGPGEIKAAQDDQLDLCDRGGGAWP